MAENTGGGDAADFIRLRRSSNGAKVLGIKTLGPLFLDPIHGIVFEDRNNPGRYYRLFVSDANVNVEEITL